MIYVFFRQKCDFRMPVLRQGNKLLYHLRLFCPLRTASPSTSCRYVLYSVEAKTIFYISLNNADNSLTPVLIYTLTHIHDLHTFHGINCCSHDTCMHMTCLSDRNVTFTCQYCGRGPNCCIHLFCPLTKVSLSTSC